MRGTMKNTGRPDYSRKKKPGKSDFWSLVDHPSPRAQREISKAVKRLRNEIKDLPGVTIDAEGSSAIIQDCGLIEAGETPLAYDPRIRAILVNDRCKFWDNPKKHMRRLHSNGHLCTSRPDHLELHEVGHARHHFAAGVAYNEIRQILWVSTEQTRLAAHLSYRASIRPIEFVAEAYVGFRLGVPMNSELRTSFLALYESLKGPTW
jgi:hypothetical protein